MISFIRQVEMNEAKKNIRMSFVIQSLSLEERKNRKEKQQHWEFMKRVKSLT
jgi:hypothetical protein